METSPTGPDFYSSPSSPVSRPWHERDQGEKEKKKDRKREISISELKNMDIGFDLDFCLCILSVSVWVSLLVLWFPLTSKKKNTDGCIMPMYNVLTNMF